MSTLVAQTISNGTVSTSSANVIQGSAKAWVNFDGVTTATIRASYNISSVIRNSTGNYTINLTNALADANYAVLSTVISNNSAPYVTSGNQATAQTTTAFRITTSSGPLNSDNSANFIDLPNINVAIFR
jgi:hypothetical protein